MYTEDHDAQSAQHSAPQSMPQSTQRQTPLRCANCDIDILWPATVAQGKTYCCLGCAAGGPCTCDYSEYSSVNVSGVIYYGAEAKYALQRQRSEANEADDRNRGDHG
jgi:hypothetical protein